MIYKLHLTRAELEILAAAVEDHQEILNHALANPELSVPEDLRDDQGRSAVIAEKIHLLISYAILIEESNKAKSRAESQRAVYLRYIKAGKKAPDQADPDNLEVLSDPESGLFQ